MTWANLENFLICSLEEIMLISRIPKNNLKNTNEKIHIFLPYHWFDEFKSQRKTICRSIKPTKITTF